MKSFRPILLLLAGIVILATVYFREAQLADWRENEPPRIAAPRQLAPRFQVADHARHVVKFERFLGRQRVVLLFFDAELGADRDPWVQMLIPCATSLKQKGIEIIAISDATPYANLEAEQRLGKDFPFPILTDIDISIPTSSPVHRMYGLFDEKRNLSLNGLFLVERDGTVPLNSDGKPMAIENVEETLKELCSGHWPR